VYPLPPLSAASGPSLWPLALRRCLTCGSTPEVKTARCTSRSIAPRVPRPTSQYGRQSLNPVWRGPPLALALSVVSFASIRQCCGERRASHPTHNADTALPHHSPPPPFVKEPAHDRRTAPQRPAEGLLITTTTARRPGCSRGCSPTGASAQKLPSRGFRHTPKPADNPARRRHASNVLSRVGALRAAIGTQPCSGHLSRYPGAAHSTAGRTARAGRRRRRRPRRRPPPPQAGNP